MLHLSTVADSKNSNPSWVNIQSAGWVKIQSARTRNLSLRAFAPKVKREAYTRQGGICADGACPDKGRVFQPEEMEADHVDPWHAGGKTTLANCKMRCKACNRRKGGV